MISFYLGYESSSASFNYSLPQSSAEKVPKHEKTEEQRSSENDAATPSKDELRQKRLAFLDKQSSSSASAQSNNSNDKSATDLETQTTTESNGNCIFSFYFYILICILYTLHKFVKIIFVVIKQLHLKIETSQTGTLY